MKYNWPYSGPMLCLSAEGGTSGKNSSTDQRQIQATSQEGPVLGGDGNINTGTSVSTSSGNIAITDGGAVAAAFEFGEGVVAEVSKIFTDQASLQAATVAGNTAFLKDQTALLSANSAGGQSEIQSKTLLYIVLGVLGLIGAIFYFRS